MANKYRLYDGVLGTDPDVLQESTMAQLAEQSPKPSTGSSAADGADAAKAEDGGPWAAIATVVLGNVLKDIQNRRQMALKARELQAQSLATPYIEGEQNPGLAMLSRAYQSGYGRS